MRRPEDPSSVSTQGSASQVGTRFTIAPVMGPLPASELYFSGHSGVPRLAVSQRETDESEEETDRRRRGRNGPWTQTATPTQIHYSNCAKLQFLRDLS
jgi:hypothetical protein